MLRTHSDTLPVLQTKLAVNFPLFASQRSYGYSLSQETENFTHQLFFSNTREVSP